MARSLIESRFPELVGRAIRSLGNGWDNSAFLVGEAFVFRFPRRAIAVSLMETECALLPALAAYMVQRGAAPVPAPCFIGEPSDAYPWPFAGYSYLPGRTACAARLDDRTREALAVPLGRFLRTLHGFPLERARKLGAPVDRMRRLDLKYRSHMIRERLAEAARLGLLDEVAPFQAILTDVPGDWSAPCDALVHGDLYVRHVLLDPENRLAGVIDWGDVHCGARALDLSLGWSFLPPSAHGAFLRAYGAVDEASWKAARLRALLIALTLLLYGADTADDDLLQEARVSLSYLARSAAL